MARGNRIKERPVRIPKKSLNIDLKQDLSDHASELLWGQGFLATYKTKYGDKRLQEILKINEFDKQFPWLEKLLSLYGNIFTTLDVVNGTPVMTICDPVLNSQMSGDLPQINSGMYGMGRALVSDEVAVVWKRITYGTVNFPIKEIWDKKKVVRYFYGKNNKQITMAAVNKEIPKEYQLDEVWEHNMGFVPVIWHMNLPSYNSPARPDGYKGESVQIILNKTLSELYHETETNRTRLIGNLDESTYGALAREGRITDGSLNRDDFLVNIKFKNSTGSDDNQLIPILADPKFDAYWLSINKAKDEYYQLGGYSPLGDGSSEKTATENILMKTNDYQTTKKKRNLRYQELSKLLKYMILLDIKFGFGQVYSSEIEEDLTFEIMENKVMDSLNEITNINLLVDNMYMSRVEAIAQIRGVSKEEARTILEEILAEQEELFGEVNQKGDEDNEDESKEDR